MTTTLVVAVIVLAFLLAGVLLPIALVVIHCRRQRRLALQRLLVIEAANSRLRAISRGAVSAMVDETLRLRRGAR